MSNGVEIKVEIGAGGAGDSGVRIFREGDIVRGEALDGGPEGVVVGTHWGVVWTKWNDTGATVSLPARCVTLLRRPVRVGDVLKTPSGHTFAATDRDVRVGDHDLCVHEDGTPIDRPERKPQGLTAGCEACNHSWPRCVCPEASRAPARIVGHTRDGRLVLGSGSPDPTNDEQIAYWAKVGRDEAPAESRELSSGETLAPALGAPPTWEEYRRSWTVPRSTIAGVVEWSSQHAIHSHPICKCGSGIAIGDTVRMFDVCCGLHFFGANSEAHEHMVARKATAARGQAERGASPALVDVVAKIAAEAITGRPTVERLSRALFESDDDVIAFVEGRSEWQRPGEFVVNPNLTEEGQAAARALHEKHQAAWSATMQTAWTRGHAGESPEWKWYVRAADRAKRMHAALGGGK